MKFLSLTIILSMMLFIPTANSQAAINQDSLTIKQDLSANNFIEYPAGEFKIYLYKDVAGSWEGVDNLFIDESLSKKKFGATDLSNLDIEKYKYVVQSEKPFNENGYYPFYSVNGKIYQLSFADVCEKENINNKGVNASCQVTYSKNKDLVEIEFFSNSDIDPEIFVQQGMVTISGVLRTNVTISPVNESRAFVIAHSSEANSGAPNVLFAWARLVNDTTVEIGRSSNSATGTQVGFDVIEHTSMMVYRGLDTFDVTDNQILITIPEVNTSRSFIKTEVARTGTSAAQYLTALWTSEFLNSTVINFTRLNDSSTIPAGELAWNVVEWSSADVIHGTVEVSGNDTFPIEQVNLSRAFILPSVRSSSNLTGEILVEASFLNASVLNFRTTSETGNAIVNYQIIQTPDVAVVDSGHTEIPSVASVVQDIPEIQLNKTFSIHTISPESVGATTLFGRFRTTRTAMNTTTITFTKGQTASDVSVAYFILELLNATAAPEPPEPPAPTINASFGRLLIYPESNGITPYVQLNKSLVFE